MVLPYKPSRTTWDLTLDLNDPAVTRRVFNGPFTGWTDNSSTATALPSGTSYDGKHIKIIGNRNEIDTRGCFLLYGPASVTVIGGYFKPPANGWARGSDGNYAPAMFTYHPGNLTAAEFYMEGVVIDNENLIVQDPTIGENGGDALFISGRLSNMTVTLQNVHIRNVRGVETLAATINGVTLTSTQRAAAHGDFFQTASKSQGATGDIRMYNVTANGNYQGFYMNPQTTSNAALPDGKIKSLTMNRVNLSRTTNNVDNTAHYRELFFFDSPATYTDRGYPVTMTDVYVKGRTGESMTDVIWPADQVGSTANFTVKEKAKIETINGVEQATYPGLTDAGKVFSGKILYGDPPKGDFAPLDKVGLNYVAGSDPADAAPAPPWEQVTDGNLLLPQLWASTGTGTVSINGFTGQLQVNGDGTNRATLTAWVPTVIGQKYRLTYHSPSGTQVGRRAGTVAGTYDLISEAFGTIAPGDNAAEFIATTSSSFVEFTRVTAASPQIVAPILERVPTNARSARRLNGLNQYFELDVSAAAMRTANYNWFIGGWVRYTYLPTTGSYIFDFGTTGITGGQGRCRLALDPTANKIYCSRALATSGYQERNFVTTTIKRDVWYHVGMLCPATGDIQLYFNGALVGTVTGSTTPNAEDTCKLLRFGSRADTTATGFAPARYGDWIWTSNKVPTLAQIQALASGTKPDLVTGLAPSVWWAFDNATGAEVPKLGTGTLTAVGGGANPPVVVGVTSGAEVVVAPPKPPLDCIFI